MTGDRLLGVYGAKSLLTDNSPDETMSGCMVMNEFSTNVVARIASGSYDAHFKKKR